jgi:hypothetical protein
MTIQAAQRPPMPARTFETLLAHADNLNSISRAGHKLPLQSLPDWTALKAKLREETATRAGYAKPASVVVPFIPPAAPVVVTQPVVQVKTPKIPPAPIPKTTAPAVSKLVTNDDALAKSLPTEVRLKAMECQRQQQMLIARVNRDLPPGCHVLQWNIIPVGLFTSDLGKFLMLACDFFAFGTSNTLLLPAMPAGEAHLNIPRHPFVTDPAYVMQAQQLIANLRDKVQAEHRRAKTAISSGDLSKVYDSATRQNKYKTELLSLVERMAVSHIGKANWNKHEDLFRAKLMAKP